MKNINNIEDILRSNPYCFFSTIENNNSYISLTDFEYEKNDHNYIFYIYSNTSKFAGNCSLLFVKELDDHINYLLIIGKYKKENNFLIIYSNNIVEKKYPFKKRISNISKKKKEVECEFDLHYRKFKSINK